MLLGTVKCGPVALDEAQDALIACATGTFFAFPAIDGPGVLEIAKLSADLNMIP